jgi:SAM-dependent methyltransferase
MDIQIGRSSACRVVELITRGDALGGRRRAYRGMGMSPGCVVVVIRMAEAGARSDGVAANRELWTQANSEYTDEHAYRAWAAEDITWGIFNVPEQQLGVLSDVRGLDVIELGCGTAYFSAWLARRGARSAGVDVTPAQLESARRCQDRFGITFPLIEADAGDVPLPSGCFDLAVSECGASLWCDPARWVPEAARLLRPGGKLVFHTTTILVTVCSPGPGGPAGQELLHPQRQAHRLATPRGGIQFHPGHGEWITILRNSGFIIDALHELYAPPDAPDHPYYALASTEWARQWPAEEVWTAHLAY